MVSDTPGAALGFLTLKTEMQRSRTSKVQTEIKWSKYRIIIKMKLGKYSKQMQ